MEKIAFVYYGPHIVHIECIRSIGDVDYYQFKPKFLSPYFNPISAFFKTTILPNYDLYFVEGGTALSVVAFKKILKNKGKIIFHVCDPLFYFIEKMPVWKKYYVKFLASKIDGATAVSTLAKEYAEKYIKGPIKITPNFVLNKERFLRVKPKITSKKLVYVGDYIEGKGYSKGVDILVNTFKIIEKNIPNSKIFMLGKGIHEAFSKSSGKNTIMPGFVDPIDYFRKAAFYISTPRFDAFPISVIEATVSGLIPIVTYTNGAKDLVKKIDSSLVVDSLEPRIIAKKVLEIMKRSEKELRFLSRKSRKIGKRYSKENGIKNFKRAFRELVSEIL